MFTVHPRLTHHTRHFIVFGILLAFLLVSPGFAQESTPETFSNGAVTDDEVNAIAQDMFCPVCENVPLDVCPTQACAQWRELIRQRLGEGWSEKQIKDYFVQQYGDKSSLAEPPRTGLNWLVYIIPPVIVLIGVVIVVQVLRSWKLQTAHAAINNPPPTIDDDYVRRLEEELKRRD